MLTDTKTRGIRMGDWVVATEDSDYESLIGVVIAIDRFGTLEHETENEEDDIHVDFTAFDYSPQRISEVEERFSELYGETLSFDYISLDDVIMAPYMLAIVNSMQESNQGDIYNIGVSNIA